MSQDRAARMATAIMTMFVEGVRAWIRNGITHSIKNEVENYLRDEIAATVREARADFKLIDD